MTHSVNPNKNDGTDSIKSPNSSIRLNSTFIRILIVIILFLLIGLAIYFNQKEQVGDLTQSEEQKNNNSNIMLIESDKETLTDNQTSNAPVNTVLELQSTSPPEKIDPTINKQGTSVITLTSPTIADHVTYGEYIPNEAEKRIDVPSELVDIITENGESEELNALSDILNGPFTEYTLNNKLLPNEFTIEIFQADTLDSINAFIDEHAISNYLIYIIQDEDLESRYLLVKGKFLTREEAEIAQIRLNTVLETSNSSILEGKDLGNTFIMPPFNKDDNE